MAERTPTVLFADVSESTKLYELVDDALASETMRTCLDHKCARTEAFGGRVIKTIGDEVMALFGTPGAAASAAAEMQFLIDNMAPTLYRQAVTARERPVLSSGANDRSWPRAAVAHTHRKQTLERMRDFATDRLRAQQRIHTLGHLQSFDRASEMANPAEAGCRHCC